MFNINFADDCSWTADFWYWKRLLYQLSHNHFLGPEYLIRLLNLEQSNFAVI